MKGLDVDVLELDFIVLLLNKKWVLLELVDMKGFRGKSFEGDVDWGISILIFKDFGGIDFDVNLVEGDVEFVSIYDNIEFYSKLEFFFLVVYEELYSF